MRTEIIEHPDAAYSFWEVFSGHVIPSRMQPLKPESEIHAHLLGTYRLNIDETNFVDDVDANLIATARFGVRTIKFEDPRQCEEQLRALGRL